MKTYRVHIKNNESVLFFEGEAFDEYEAIDAAQAAYYSKYPECDGNFVEWSVSVSKEHDPIIED